MILPRLRPQDVSAAKPEAVKRPALGGRAADVIADGGRTLGAVMYLPEGLSRADRRSAHQAARRVEAEARRKVTAARRSAIAAASAEQQAAAYLPKGGESGPAALRSYRRLKIQPHRVTSEVLAAAYPFLAEAGLGSKGVLIGHDSWSGAAFVFDPWALYGDVLTNPNILLAGVVGRGKSTIAKSLAVRSIAFGRKVYVPGDPKGEWSVVSKAVGGIAIELGSGTGNRLNPLDDGPAIAGFKDSDWAEETKNRQRALLGSLTETALRRSLGPTEQTAVDVALADVRNHNTVPILPHVVAALFTPRAGVGGSSVQQLTDDGRQAGHHSPLRPDRTDGQPRPVTDRTFRRSDSNGHDMRVELDGVSTVRPVRRAALGDLRRSMAATAPTVPASQNAVTVEAQPSAWHRQPHDHPPDQRSRRSRRSRLIVSQPRPRAARRLLNQDHLRPRSRRSTRHGRRPWTNSHRDSRATRPTPRRRTVARR